MYWPLLNMYSENFGFRPGGFIIRGRPLQCKPPGKIIRAHGLNVCFKIQERRSSRKTVRKVQLASVQTSYLPTCRSEVSCNTSRLNFENTREPLGSSAEAWGKRAWPQQDSSRPWLRKGSRKSNSATVHGIMLILFSSYRAPPFPQTITDPLS